MSVPFRSTLVAVVVCALLAGPASGQGKAPPSWEEIEQLASDQKLDAALKGAEARLGVARGGADEAEWTKALIKVTQLRLGLHGYETAVRALREQRWPEGALARSAVELFYAHSLVAYAQGYSFEIRRRERVESKDAVDLRAWTLDQITAEAHRAYGEVWRRREALGRAPLATWAEYLRPNNYPKGIRDTLRDAVSYLWAELLTDSALWSPEASNGVYRLDVKALARGNPQASAKVKLEDPEVHPLVRLGAILDDLEAWHLGQGRKEAALEARLARTRWLHGAFTEPEDQRLLREDLQARLSGFTGVPWWSMGQATLAELWHDAGEMFQAHALAAEGLRAHPASVGGKKSLALVKRIEAPDFQVIAMASDGPNRRSIQVSHRNMKSLSFRAYRMDVDALVAQWKDYNLLPQGEQLLALMHARRPDAEWTVALPATPDFRSHDTYVTPPLERKGLYVLLASADPGFGQKNNRVVSLRMSLTDLVLLVRQDESGAEARVIQGESGQPIAGADVELYRYDWNVGHRRVSVKKTDAQGRTRLDLPRSSRGAYFVIARSGGQVAFETQQLNAFEREAPKENTAALVYTDRSIYRPLQKILWKVVAYRGRADLASYRVLPNAKTTVELLDGNGERVDSKVVVTNAFGSAVGEFTVPAGRLLGAWTLVSNPTGQASIRVEEYKRPTFEVTLKDPAGPLRLNAPAAFTGEARYYFGLPVSSGQVRWRVTREPVFPWWWEDRLPEARFQVIATGASPLGEDGTFKVAFTPEADERRREQKEVGYRYRVVADVTDEGGETHPVDRAFRLGWVAVEARIQAERGFFREGQGGELTVIRTDLNGTPRPGKASYRVVALEAPDRVLLPAERPVPPSPLDEQVQRIGPKVRTPGDALRPRWASDIQPHTAMREWASGEQRASGALEHRENGEAKVKVPPLPAGAYRLEYETVDEFGAKAVQQEEFIVAGERARVPLPLLLRAEEPSVRVGQVARLLVVSGLAEQRLYVDIHRPRGIERRVLVVGRDPMLLELPIREDDRGGFWVTVTAVRDYQLMHVTSSLFVPYENKELKLELSTFRDQLRPGAKETFRVSVKGPKGTRIEAGTVELLAYMYDRALDAFAQHVPPAMDRLYPQRAYGGYLRSTLGAAGGEWVANDDFPALPESPELHGDQLRFLESYGVGGPGHRRRRTIQLDALAVEGRPAGQAEDRMQKPDAFKDAPAEAPAPGRRSESLSRDPAQADAPAPPLRSNFSETAFWQPRLLTDAKGGATIEFTVPDSVTSWNVWVHGLTRDLVGGSVNGQTRTVKDLMVRPYLPRFLREGDRAELQVVLNNASERALSGQVTLEILEPETQASLLDAFGVTAADRAPKAFTVEAGKSAHVTYPLVAPARLGQVAFKVVARSGDVSDGELRPLPVLPSRMHLAQSRFAVLHGNDQRTLRFDDLAKGGDPSLLHEQLVVTLDAQLFYSVLEALPHLANFPYECTEQTLNRFVSTGIVSRLYSDHPAVARMAQQLSKRQTRLETWDAADPNRKMALEETPWLGLARGGKAPEEGVVNVLDPRAADAERLASLEKLSKAQTEIGGFPWWPGGPPSPYMTLYIAHGLARAAEYKVAFPKDLTLRAWRYLAQHYRDEYAGKLDEKAAHWEFLTFLNYVATSYPDESYVGEALSMEERKRILDYSFARWKEHSPYLKGYLALTLKRMGRAQDALKVWDSVMDSAKTTPDEGTFWMPEERSWLWYNDTTETHAFALRTLTELRPQDPRRAGLVQWLLLQKKLQHWKSTRATAEAIYALVKYLEQEKELGIREELRVQVGPVSERFVFEPDTYTGKKNQVVIPGSQVDAKMATVEVHKPSKGFAFASATWRFSTEKLPEAERGDFFSVSRRYFKREKQGREVVLKPLQGGEALLPGDEVEVQLSLRTKHAAEYVHLRDPRAAGFEPENAVSRYKWDQGLSFYEETRDSGTNFFFDWLPAGEYTFRYRIRASLGGTFRVGPATVQSLYAPEFNAYSAGAVLKIGVAP